ncbi:hypothetical protein MUB04_14720 [Acinetobacter indicus]|uniref:hypothetical protein n=1 Tax=Acinetobacter TaxID=469 RepID=UPI0015D25595|nr:MULTISPECIES: hypothetical protein [Acinetobacter]MCP0917786.1 hypothetical protein [Acinetobacter indicus]
MSIKIKISSVLLATLALGLIACQDQKKENVSPEIFHQKSIPAETPTPTVKNLASESQNSIEEYRKLTPVSDNEFKENMRRKYELLEKSNAKLDTSYKTHNAINNANINSNDNVTTKSDKNTGLTELDAVEQAIQAAAPALEDTTEN